MKIILNLLFFLCFTTTAFAAAIVSEGSSIAVMDFGTHPGATTGDVAILNAEGTTSEYIIAKLVESGKFVVKDKDYVQQKIKEMGIKTVGIIDPRQAQQLGELLGVQYIIYGNVNDISASENGTNVATPLPNLGGNVTIHTVKCHIIARVLDVRSGFIVAAAKGEGKSRSSLTDLRAIQHGIKIGTVTLTQASVHNAIQKAAYDTVSLLEAKMLGKVLVKK